MQLKNFGTMLDISKAMNRLTFIGFLFMTALSVILGLCVYRLIDHKTTVVVPAHINKHFTVSYETVDQSYILQMARFILSLQLNVTPSNVVDNHNLILSYVSSNQYHSLLEILKEDENAIISSKISSVFYPQGTAVVDMNHLAIRISGVLKKWVGERELEPKKATYEIDFSYKNGTLLVQSINELQESHNG